MNWIRRHRYWLFALIIVGGLLSCFEGKRVWREHSQDEHILAAARKYGVEAALVKAVVWRESRFNPRARGTKGEVGLMQLRQASAGEWAAAEGLRPFSLTQLFDPAQNTQAGAWYLRRLLRRYPQTDNPVPYALADYNAGRTHVLRWIKGRAATNSAAFIAQIDFPQTRQYVQAVAGRFEKYRRVFPPREPRNPS